jgi:hypothetical protein
MREEHIMFAGNQFYERFCKNQAGGSSWHNGDADRAWLACDQVIFGEVICAWADPGAALLPFNQI